MKVLKNHQLEHALNVPVAAAMIAKFTLALSNLVININSGAAGTIGQDTQYAVSLPRSIVEN